MTATQFISARMAAFDALDWRKRLFIRAVGIAGAVGVLVPAFWNGSGFGPSARGAQGVYDRIEAGGTPLNTDDFMKSWAVPESQNCFKEAYPAAKRIGASFDPSSYDDSIERVIQDGWPTYTRKPVPSAEVFERALKPFAGDLAIIKRALRKPYFVAPDDWVSPETMEYRSAGMNRSYSLLSVRAWTYARQGKRAEAVDDMRDAIRIVHAISSAPGSGRLYSLAGRAKFLSEEVLRCVQADPGGAREYRQLLDFPPLPSVLQGLRADVYCLLATFRDLSALEYFKFGLELMSDSAVEQRPTRQRAGLPSDPIVRALAGRMLERNEILLNAFDREGREVRPGAFESAAAQVHALSEKQTGVINHLAGVVGSYAYDLPGRTKDREAHLATAKALVEVVVFHNRHGRWPKSLAEASCADSDPFAPTLPLLYRVTARDVRVWSRGKDGIDENGLTSQERTAAKINSRTRDIVFVFRR